MLMVLGIVATFAALAVGAFFGIRALRDNRPGAAVVLHFDLADLPATERDSRWSQTESRVAERVSRLGDARIIDSEVGAIRVRFPGKTPAEISSAAATLAKPGRLEFRLVHPGLYSVKEKLPRSQIPAGYSQLPLKEWDNQGRPTTTYFLLRRIPEQTGEDVAEAYPLMGPFGGFEIMIRFTESGSRRFAEVTGNNIGARLGIVLDGQLYSAPRINDRIAGGAAQITGNFSQREAVELAGALAAPLPLPATFTLENADGTPFSE